MKSPEPIYSSGVRSDAAALQTRAQGAAAAAADLPEPSVGDVFETPMWLVALLGLILYWGVVYLDQNGGEFHPLVFNLGERLPDVEARVPKSDADALAANGKRIYGTYCVACHQPNGRGTPGQFPPLVESEWALASGPNRIIRIVLSGLQGPITVKGQDFNNVMLPWRDQLTDDDIAAVLTFVRGNKEWGHSATPVTPAQVKAIRTATESRGTTAWTPAELQGIPEKD